MNIRDVLLVITIFVTATTVSFAQQGIITGQIEPIDEDIIFASVSLDSTVFGAVTDEEGRFNIASVPFGNYKLIVTAIGYNTFTKALQISPENPTLDLIIELEKGMLDLDVIVVTGTKTAHRQTDSPVIVNVVNSETLAQIQACNLSEGLRFQPGLRVETDCQTCNYTQLRMNGLAGGYSQVLINGRPIFSPLTGLYGLEQLPVNMIDRIEVVRGGGSSLYGSSAVGGTVNVITKIPKTNSYELNYNYQQINGQTSDNQITGNSTFVSEDMKSGISFFMNHRKRDFYDHNADGFSEIPLIENTSIGTNLFFIPGENQKIEGSLSNIKEYRFGGEMTGKAAYLTQQSEERTHGVWMGSLDYQVNFNNSQSSLITYLAGQQTSRNHYTGILPDDPLELESHYKNPPYGTSKVKTFNAGLQFDYRFHNFLAGINTLTIGTEYIFDTVKDDIPAYNYLIDQTSKDLGVFVQSDWEITPGITFLSGLRMDHHNLVDELVCSPRASLLFKYKDNTQFRINYGAGFRAPQAFDADLHIAFAGGGVSRVLLSPELEPERSQSLSASLNFDKPADRFIAGFTLETFYTRLNEAFFLKPIGEDNFGEVFEKQNGQGAVVQGGTLEVRANYNRKLQLETGFTLQTSRFDLPVEYIDGLEAVRDFIRTPNAYGFANLNITTAKRFSANINYIYTGSMIIPHFGGAVNQEVDEMIDSNSFSELSAKVSYTIKAKRIGTNVEFYSGVRNIFNSYQKDFDVGKNRDSNFVFGPAQPRTIFLGVKLNSN